MNTDNLSVEQLVEAAIRSALQVADCPPTVRRWAERWLSGEDRSFAAAAAPWAEAQAEASAWARASAAALAEASASAWARASAEAWAEEAAERSLRLSREAGVDVDAILEEIRGRA
jgi:hypothetical protein